MDRSSTSVFSFARMVATLSPGRWAVEGKAVAFSGLIQHCATPSALAVSLHVLEDRVVGHAMPPIVDLPRLLRKRKFDLLPTGTCQA